MINKIKLKYILIFLFAFLLISFKILFSIISIDIIKVSNYSDDIYSIIIKKKWNNNDKDKKDIKFYLKSNINELNKKVTIKESIKDEDLNKYRKKINSLSCICLYDKPKLIFREISPVKIETNCSLQLNLDIINSPLINIKYNSNHPEIIRINKEGKITAIRPGNATITANQFGLKSAKINIISISTKGLITNNTLDEYKAKKYKNIMIVAHPDDETLWGGADLMKESYFVVCLTNNYHTKRSKEFLQIMNFTNNSGILLDYPDYQDGIIDNWSNVEEGILKDLTTILNYNNWEKIVTYGPDGTYGHIHHKKTSKFVTMITKRLRKYNNLYYFGKYYKKNKIPKNLSKITQKELEYKNKEISFYKNTKEGIDKYFIHVMPYEKFISASESKNQYKN